MWGMYVCMRSGHLEGRGVKCPEAGVTGGNKLPNMGAENPVHTLWKSILLSHLLSFNF